MTRTPRIIHVGKQLAIPGPPGVCWQQDPQQLQAGNLVAPRCTKKTGHQRTGKTPDERRHTWQ
jgi:hypothetical protein